MIIKIAQHQGMCFGVRDAMALAETTARQGPVSILGQLVHNPLVRSRLAGLGASEIPLESPSAPQSKVMITAHGASDAVRQGWQQRDYHVTDATCPLVRRAHEQLRKLVAEGFHPVVIGTPGHVEVRGLTGDFPGAKVIQTEEDFPILPSDRPLGIISQTTQPITRVLALLHRLRALRPSQAIRFCDTVCQPTKDRQRALHELCGEVDMIVVVGGRNSNNTLHLLAEARSLGLDARHVECAGDLRPEWFAGIERVGITAGTSTLPETVEAVRKRLEQFDPPSFPFTHSS